MPSSKSELRKQARARRTALAHPEYAARLAGHVAALEIADGSLVGAYVALPSEADPTLLLQALISKGCRLAFPRVVEQGQPLAFHRWNPGDEMTRGAYGIAEPSADWPFVFPRILLVPLLAFDAKGHRLGYGGGFYDRTIALLRARGPLRAIGVAYAGQEAAELPHEEHDAPLDAVVTEEGVRSFAVPNSR
jgi:5-formyltetrahydrofolate cyclo-ligase